LHLSGSPNQASDEATTQTDGGFRKVRYTLSRQQNISGSWSLLGSLSGQWSDKNLDSSEKFYLGGSAGVRAYPSSEGGGAWGQLATLELRYQWGGGVTLAGFQDFGQVKTNPNNDFVGAPALNEFALRGTGVSFAWQNATGMNLKAVVAQRVGSNPNATPAGMDQDGTLTNNRLWLSASLDF
jgi:hemolysin activation/secretion protein